MATETIDLWKFKQKYYYKHYDVLKDYFYDHQDLFKKTINGESHTNKHKNNLKILQEVFKVKFPYGKCFPISQFMFYFLGGYDSEYELKCINKIPIHINGFSFTTSHWFVQRKNTNVIIDLSKEQFDKILDIESLYTLSRRANYGYKYFHNNKDIKYDSVVPCLQVLRLYKSYRELHEKSEVLEFYYERCGYEL